MTVAEAQAFHCDLLVIGAGMAGLTAAAAAADASKTVLVVEKAEEIGGSAVLSSGYVWTLDHIEDFDAVDPDGDRSLHQVLVDEFPVLIKRIKAGGTPITERMPVLHGSGHQVDVAAYLQRCVHAVESGGGHVIRGASVRELTAGPRRVSGALIDDSSGTVRVESAATLIATGGFAQAPDVRAKMLGEPARDLRARAGAMCLGDGLLLACGAGADGLRGESFYGHLVGAGVDLGRPELWDQLTLLHSRAGWLFGRDGRRFTEESRGDNVNAEATLRQPGKRALLVWDEKTHVNTVLVSWPPGNPAVDRFEVALSLGATGRLCAGPDEVTRYAKELGFAAPVLPPEASGPLHALLVEPTITFPYAGIRGDSGARALDTSGVPVAGLFVAGADLGGVYAEGYAGGLALAGTFALRAMRTAGFLVP
jgi:succinate dehydrogenase/fumarate reductase flavoprotein subunit